MRAWLMSSVLACVSCSDGSVRSGSLPDPADFLPMAGDGAAPASSVLLDADTLGLTEGEHPRLVLRCEAGRLGAYLVVGAEEEVESGPIGHHAVEVRLDSAPSC